MNKLPMPELPASPLYCRHFYILAQTTGSSVGNGLFCLPAVLKDGTFGALSSLLFFPSPCYRNGAQSDAGQEFWRILVISVCAGPTLHPEPASR